MVVKCLLSIAAAILKTKMAVVKSLFSRSTGSKGHVTLKIHQQLPPFPFEPCFVTNSDKNVFKLVLGDR